MANDSYRWSGVRTDASRATDGGPTIAGHTVAKECVLRSIPREYIEAAKASLHIMYCGTSHSSQLTDGMRGLTQSKPGDDVLYAVTFDGVPRQGSLDIDYRPNTPVDLYDAARDLSHDSADADGHTAYFRKTVEYLDHPAHADVNVVMWSWCSIQGHDAGIYLANVAELIDLYRAGGRKGRRVGDAVTFVFMTGYARGDEGDTPEPPYLQSAYQNHRRIRACCEANAYFLLDYWSHDTHHYATDRYAPLESGNNNAMHKEYSDAHREGIDWFATRNSATGDIRWPAHCSDPGYEQHITSNRRAYAAWWVWARLAGWQPRRGAL